MKKTNPWTSGKGTNIKRMYNARDMFCLIHNRRTGWDSNYDNYLDNLTKDPEISAYIKKARKYLKI